MINWDAIEDRMRVEGYILPTDESAIARVRALIEEQAAAAPIVWEDDDGILVWRGDGLYVEVEEGVVDWRFSVGFAGMCGVVTESGINGHTTRDKVQAAAERFIRRWQRGAE